MMRGLILALVLGAGLWGQAPLQDSKEPAKPDAQAQFENQLDHFAGSWASAQQKFAAQAREAEKSRFFATPEQSRKYFTELRPGPAAPAPGEPKERINLKPGQACAIPLLNVLRRGDVDPKMILPVGPEAKASIKNVIPPAPSCDDVK